MQSPEQNNSTTLGGSTISYIYDDIDQLKQVDDPTDTTAGSTGTTWIFEYDYGGNIKAKTACVYGTDTVVASKSITYTYGNSGWKDQLTKIKVGTAAAKTIQQRCHRRRHNFLRNRFGGCFGSKHS